MLKSHNQLIIAEEEPAPGVPEWFVTFADMMTLLLAFFVMLVSMSTFQEPRQFQSFVAMINEQFGHNPSQGEVEKNFVIVANSDTLPDVQRRGTTLPGGIVPFAQLATDLTEANKRDLNQIAHKLTETNSVVEIRGHSAQVVVDPKSGLRDVWDLVDRRCRNVLGFLVERGVDPSRIRLANAGVSEPIYNGADMTRLDENSRVEIRLIETGLDRF